MKKQAIVTKVWLAEKISLNPERVIGRVLVAIFRNQTSEERDRNTTRFSNGIGFTGTDGRIGALTAKYYLKHGRLEQWQIDNWLKPNRRGEPRIVKYTGQLNDIAVEKKRRQDNGFAILQDTLLMVTPINQ